MIENGDNDTSGNLDKKVNATASTVRERMKCLHDPSPAVEGDELYKYDQVDLEMDLGYGSSMYGIVSL